MGQPNYRTIYGPKLMQAITEIRAKKKLTYEGFAASVGYSWQGIRNMITNNRISSPLARMLEVQYGIKLIDLQEDEKKPPAKQQQLAVPMEEKAEKAQPAGLSPEDRQLLEELSRRVKSIMEKNSEMAEIAQMIRAGLQVQTTPRLDTQAIAGGVEEGLTRFWRQKKIEIMQQVKGTMISAINEAAAIARRNARLEERT